ncbi:hypothetical protein AMJ86_06470 [bacterium SM23_57]|nr:MAG: hypothetical protein AMJ86_06470 [bacterium SM23_57]
MGFRTIVIATMVFLLCLGMVGPVGAVYQIGEHVNDFTLPNAHGVNVSLYDYQDFIVVMPFWFTG